MKKAITLIVCLVFLIATAAIANDVTINTEFNGVGEAIQQVSQHEDADPWKGFAYFTVKNTSSIAWGDFHFKIVSWDPQFPDVSSVDFVVTEPFQPTSSQSPLSWVVNNDLPGSTLDLYFYGDPVMPGEIATFIIYTDNTADMTNFGLSFYPTPVPEPSSLVALATGLIGFAGFIRRKLS